ncbi:MAG: DNA glycosylase AlkZ-like family protein [Gaiellaceae bacterium]
MRVTAEAARRFFVARHLLAPARSIEGGIDAVPEFLRRFGSIQYDPIAVAGRSHDLVLHARVADYDPAWCELLYERREVFEAVNKGLSFVLTTDYPWFRATQSRNARRVLAENAQAAERVLERVRADGPLSALDFERQHGVTVDWFGVRTNVVRAVLEAYTVTGVLGLARRDGSRRYYDVIERLLPRVVLERDVPLHDQLRHKMLSRYRAHGLLGASSGGDVFGGLGPAKPDPRYPEYPGRTALREGLIEEGELVPVEVEGVRGPRFVLRNEVDVLAAWSEPPPSVAFLSPFDPLIWDRALLGSLFAFDYVWDLFHPPAKRRYGWYVLPMLFCDRFVGRIEPRIDRDSGCVQVLGLWWEDGFAPRRADGFVDAMKSALRAYLGFAAASRLEWASHLNTEKRLFLTRP